ncbi:hypothetical protein SUGI_0622320 [Cryptomeria japonica]|uniref:co-chaperone protein p23-1 n=1 Tax=Cryptomeria japonica TaxID=3369 RepID=UPI002414BD08|nr:co-chaperone protein p23-1 [Cryptomeria japonica]GLJ31090.1 hypothetical protein SUGI_0622320 [Cryptomeria japonica]
MSRHPEVKWAQRSDKIYITIELPDANNPKVKVEPEGKLSFSARVGKDQVLYEFGLDLLDRVNVKESKTNVGLRNIVCIIEKEEKKWWKQLVKTEGKRLSFLKVDWNKWVDEDEDGGKDMDLSQMDFSKLGMDDDDLDYNELEDEEEIGSENQSADEKEGQEPHIEDSGKGKAIET